MSPPFSLPTPVFNMVHHINVSLTNVVVQSSVNVKLPLNEIIHRIGRAKYNPRRWSGLSWSHPKISGSVMLFPNGRLVSHGSRTILQARKVVRQYARLLQKMGYGVILSPIRLVTASAIATLPTPVSLAKLASGYPMASWESELFNACLIKKDGMHYSVFSSGRVVICGIKRLALISPLIKPTLLEFTLFQ